MLWRWARACPMRASHENVWILFSICTMVIILYVVWEVIRGLTQAIVICFMSFLFLFFSIPLETSILKTVAGHTEIQPIFKKKKRCKSPMLFKCRN